MLLSGAAIIIECLKEQGVNTVFGYPGGTILAVYDELYRHSGEIRHILTAHEQGAAHAADGYARSTGKTGVCMVTSGPGATNLVTGIATAYMDSVPLVAITINVPVSSLGKDSFQEVDIAGITMPVTKHNFIVKDISELADTMRRAFKIAESGRKGPVLIDITKEVTLKEYGYEPVVYSHSMERKGIEISDNNITAAVRLLKKAKKPVILLGGGAVSANAQKSLYRLLEVYDAPVCDTLMGKGVCAGDDVHYVGMVGIHGTIEANYCMERADTILAVGTRFSERVTSAVSSFAANAKIIQIDVDRAELNKNVIIDCGIVGDCGEIIELLAEKLGSGYEYGRWIDEVRQAAKVVTQTVETCHIGDSEAAGKENEAALTGKEVIEIVCSVTKGDAIIATEVGQNQMLTAQNYIFSRPRTLLTSGGLGTMGYGLGAAIGAQAGNPDRLVINIAGDGCFRMNMSELITAVAYRLPVIEIILNNRSLGMVKQMQASDYGGRYSQTLLSDNVDYIKISEAVGAVAYRVKTGGELYAALSEAVKDRTTAVIECIIDENELV